MGRGVHHGGRGEALRAARFVRARRGQRRQSATNDLRGRRHVGDTNYRGLGGKARAWEIKPRTGDDSGDKTGR